MGSKYKRIFVTGASGVGKTTLAQTIGLIYDLEFISTSVKPLWEKYGFFNHADAIHKSSINPSLAISYQMDALALRHKALKDKLAFTTDRSPFDNMAYFLLSCGYVVCQNEMDVFTKLCIHGIRDGDAIIFIRIPDLTSEIENDGNRVTNIEYQYMVESVIDVSIKKLIPHNLPILELCTWNMDQKIEQIKKFLS